MKAFSEFVVRYRWPIIVFVLGVTAVSLFLAKGLSINSDVVTYLPQNDPYVIAFNEVGRKFGGNYLAIIGLEANDVFTYDVLVTVQKITEVLEGLEGISHVTSLTNILDFREIEGGLEVGKLIEEGKIPRDSTELQRLREYTLSKDMYRGALVSGDGRLTLIIARLKDTADRPALAQRMRREVRQIVGDRYRIYFAGMPFQIDFISSLIFQNMLRLTPITGLLILLILFLSFRSVRGVLLPFATVLISSAWAFGFMAAMGYQISIISGITPVLILAVGSAYGIHMANRYYEEIHKLPNPPVATGRALQEVGIPIAMAGLTTLIGFLSLLTSNLSIVKEFGIVTGAGIVFAFFIATTFLPASLAQMPPDVGNRSKEEGENKRDNAVTRAMDRLGAFVLKYEKPILMSSGAILIFALLGIPRITREVNMLEYFKPESEIRVAEDIMEEKFGGSIPAQLHIKGDIKNPATLKLMRDIERRLEAIPYVNDPQSVADLICEMNRVMNGRYTIPETPEGVGNLWFMLEGQKILDQMITPDNREAQIQAKLGTVNTQKVLHIVEEIDAYLETLPDTLVTIAVTDIPKAHRADWRRFLRERIAMNLQLEIQKRDASYTLDKALLFNHLDHFLQDEKSQWPEALCQSIAQKVAQYLTLEESDIFVESEAILKQVEADLKEILRKGDVTLESVAAILRRRIPPELIEFPEAIDYTAESMVALIQSEWKEERLRDLMERIKEDLPPSIAQSPDFDRDLKSVLWELNEEYVNIPIEVYRQWSEEKPIPHQDVVTVEVIHTGFAPIYKELDAKLLSSQIKSLLMALIIVFLLLSVQFRSLVGGLIGLFPIVLTLLINFGVMGHFHVALDNATMMIASLIIGIGIDYAIHFSSRFKLELKRQGDVRKALDTTLETTGVAILINAVSVGMGFLVLLLGDIVPIQRFGWLVALAMLVSSAGALTGLPALILATKARFVRK